ncbi:MAG TPA: alpha/beta fold hydrolase [Propionibacteriaceae bacterium]|nr:alpha/beta fold hydrolase [Propionibacteriaceae bacterium]
MTPALPAPNPQSGLHSIQLGESGPRIAFCHGLFGQGKNWTSIAKSLSTEFRCTLVDLPNHGRSGWTDDVSYTSAGDQLAGLLRRMAPGESYTVVGHSMGGKVAMAMALLHPSLVRRLCVVDIAPVSYRGLSSFADYVRGMRALPLDTLADRTTADRLLQNDIPDPVVRSFLLQNLRREDTGWRWQQNLSVLGDHLDDLASWPELDVDPYPGPTLWVAGGESTYVAPAHAPAMRAQFPKVQLVTIKRAGHWVHAEQPAVFVDLLRRFVRREASAGAGKQE